MCLSKNLKYLRLKHNYSQDEIATQLGYKSFTTVQKWESGIAEPPLKVITALAALYKVSMPDLLTKDLETNPSIESTSTYPSITQASEIIIKEVWGEEEYLHLSADEKKELEDSLRFALLAKKIEKENT